MAASETSFIPTDYTPARFSDASCTRARNKFLNLRRHCFLWSQQLRTPASAPFPASTRDTLASGNHYTRNDPVGDLFEGLFDPQNLAKKSRAFTNKWRESLHQSCMSPCYYETRNLYQKLPHSLQFVSFSQRLLRSRRCPR